MSYWLLILAIEFFIVAFVIWVAWSGIVGAPWVPTPKKRVRSMLEFAGVTQSDRLYDLGSGDGRVIVMAAKEFGARCTGIEVDPIRYIWSKAAIRLNKVEDRADVIRGNFFDVNLADATVVTLYQGYEINKKIRDKLTDELKPGTRVVSYRFVLEGWTLKDADEKKSVYLYVV